MDGLFESHVNEKSATGSNGGGIAGSNSSLMCLAEAFQATVSLANLGTETAADEILKLFIAAQAKHLLTAADGVLDLQIVINKTKQLIELISFLAGKDIDQFIGNMVRDSA
jgi:hypothetical protein